MIKKTAETKSLLRVIIGDNGKMKGRFRSRFFNRVSIQRQAFMKYKILITYNIKIIMCQLRV